MEPADYLVIVRRASEALLSATDGALGQPVPTCPEWEVADLVVHAGQTWGWAAEIVDTGERAVPPEAPSDRSQAVLLGWAREKAERLLATLGAADPDSNCWTFGLPRSRRFWYRRQALESTLHAYDAQRAVGAPEPIDPETAADGVDEYLTILMPRFVGRHPEGWEGQTLHLHRTDGDGEWLVRLGPDGAAETERTHGKGDVALRGTAEALWLWSTNRTGLDDLEVFGDQDLAARWTAEISF